MESAPFREASSLQSLARNALAALRWSEAVDAARRSNLLLFQSRDPDAPRLAGANYAIAALGMLRQKEWHEAAILAELALKETVPWEGEPSRPAALFILAKARFRRGERDAARAALEALAQSSASAPLPPAIAQEAESLRAKLCPLPENPH